MNNLLERLDIDLFKDNKTINQFLKISFIDLISIQILASIMYKLYGLYLPLYFISLKSFLTNVYLVFINKIIKYFNLIDTVRYIFYLTVIDIILLILLFISIYYNKYVFLSLIIYSVFTIVISLFFTILHTLEIDFIQNYTDYYIFNLTFKALSGIGLLITSGIIFLLSVFLSDIIMLILGVVCHSYTLVNFLNYLKLLKGIK